MADEIKENETLDEGYTEFGGTQNRGGMFYQPTGPIGKFFAKFFASTAQAQAVKTMDSGGPALLGGDTVVHTEVIKDVDDKMPAIGLGLRLIFMPMILHRKVLEMKDGQSKQLML